MITKVLLGPGVEFTGRRIRHVLWIDVTDDQPVTETKVGVPGASTTDEAIDFFGSGYWSIHIVTIKRQSTKVNIVFPLLCNTSKSELSPNS